jgi:hypothetical protein
MRTYEASLSSIGCCKPVTLCPNRRRDWEPLVTGSIPFVLAGKDLVGQSIAGLIIEGLEIRRLPSPQETNLMETRRRLRYVESGLAVFAELPR